MEKRVAIIILNYKTWEDTIAEVEMCNTYLNIENKDIIVIDNFSPNESYEKLITESEKKGFVFIASRENKGYGAGNNIGLKYAFSHDYSYALILNNDIVFKCSNVLSNLLKVFETDKRIAVVNPDVYNAEGYLFNRDAVKPTFFDYTVGILNYKRKGRKIKTTDGYSYVYRPQGCCMLVDLKKMNEVNYFDERTFLYYEESILAERLLNKGYLCACSTSTYIVHNHSKTVKSALDTKNIIRINNVSFAYYLKKYRKFSDWKIRICCLINALKIKSMNS